MSKQSSESKVNRSMKENQGDLNSRITILENNLSRVCLQQDAIMPAFQALENLPHLQKLENQLRGLSKRQDDLENSMKEKSRDTSANTSFSEYKSISKVNNKPLEKQIFEINQKINQLDSQLLEVQKSQQHTQFHFSFENDLVKLEHLIKDDLVQIKSDSSAEYKNIYKEISGLKCDLEYIMNNQKKNKITQKMQTMSINQEDKLFVINLLEQETFIEDLDHYENENTFRLLFELDYFESQKESVHNLEAQQSHRESLYLEEKLISIKYQLAASKRKYLMEIKRIEHKFQILKEMIQTNKKYIQYTSQIQQLDIKMQKIVSRLHSNIENVFQKINSLDRQ